MSVAAESIYDGRTERQDIRMAPTIRLVIRRAADLLGTSVSNYMTMASYEAARRDIAEHTTIEVGAKAFDTFAQALDNPDYSKLDSILARPTIWDN